ncbi:hypothetical protein B0H14DRAFT_2533367 [Mycena olivaceomarginata]|nr:hypothetical protein B0H14DRAFT_2533367 [Mycena olivaceomarginata]
MKEITPDEPGWENWPHPAELQKLYGKADGLFHYAATALQWIKQQIKEHGRSCQGWVLENLTQEGGLGRLEDLYRVILTSFEDIDNQARNARRRELRLASFQHVVGAILVLYKPLTISQIITLLADIPVGNLDAGHFLQQMRSVLIPGTTTSFEEAVPQVHKSFRDYIMDVHAPAEFRIHIGHAHFVTARSCLEVIVKTGSQSDVVVDYSVAHWYQHFRKAVEKGVTCEDKRMWNLFGQMVEEAVVDIWKEESWKIFIDVAAAGWELLKVRTKYVRESKLVRASPLLSFLALLTFPPHLVCSSCVLFLCCQSLPCSLFLPLPLPVSLIITNFSWLQPYESIWDHGLLQTWDSNQSPHIRKTRISQLFPKWS